jgi:N-acetylmuramoyl-L-alanine amidase
MVKDKLEKRGYRVVMTHEADETLSIDKRLSAAIDNSAEILVSIHQNSFDNDTVTQGIETWYCNKKNEICEHSAVLAQYIQEGTILSTGAADRGLRPDRAMIITRRAKIPSCLIETGFMTNPEECIKLIDYKYENKIANGITAGIESYFEENP